MSTANTVFDHFNTTNNEGTTADPYVVKKKAPSKPNFTYNIGVAKKVIKEKRKSKSKSQGVFIKKVIDEEELQNKKCKVVGLLKQFKMLRPQTVEERSTTTKPIKKVIEGDKDREATNDEVNETGDLTYNVYP
ncbi:unnamed protein product [Lactuca virosa]|uniref:Uncharacterized protein n=1 Tax=Lactuca virosa TaxID=75947 RepID=A0AAU9N6K3_9ASTR|nr:unnamed protein product [Lactuca virosa]